MKFQKQYKKLVIFDFDGSCNDSYLPIKATFKSFHMSFLSKETFRNVSSFRKYSNGHVVKDAKLFFHVLTMGFSQSLITHFQSMACRPETTLYPEIQETIKNLIKRDDVAVVILSRNFLDNTAFRDLIESMLSFQGIHMEDLYDVISIPFLLQKQRTIKKLIKKLNLEPEDCIMYGDEVEDWKAARRAQVPEENIVLYGGKTSFDSRRQMLKKKIKKDSIEIDLESVKQKIITKI